jgi:hypothetical protein
MHDIDRTQLEQEQFEDEWGQETQEFAGEFEDEWGHEAFEVGEFQEQEYEDEYAGEFEQEDEDFLGGLLGGLLGGELESSEYEMNELELASELLEVAGEDELEQFLGDLVQRAAGAAGTFLRSDTGRQLTGILRNAAKQALPVVGGAIGGAVAPGGAQWGSRIATAAGDLMGLELEGLSPQEQEFELARGIVRLASGAGRLAAAAPRSMPGRVIAQRSAVAAARRHAPGLLHPQRSGWLRAAPSRRPFPSPSVVRRRWAPYRARTVYRTARPGAFGDGGPVAGDGGPAAPFRRRRGRPRPYHAAPRQLAAPQRGYASRAVPRAVAPVGPRRYGYRRYPAYGWGGYDYADGDGYGPSYREPAYDWGAPQAWSPPQYGAPRTAGRWVRRGRHIVILGAG